MKMSTVVGGKGDISGIRCTAHPTTRKRSHNEAAECAARHLQPQAGRNCHMWSCTREHASKAALRVERIESELENDDLREHDA